MNVIDLNLLMFAHDEDSPFYKKARKWLESRLAGRAHVGLPVPVIMCFIRISTDRRLGGGRYGIDEAVEIVDEWLALPHVRVLLPTDRHWDTLRQILIDANASGKLSTDAQIAAVTMEYGGTLFSADRDFARFAGLRWINPLA